MSRKQEYLIFSDASFDSELDVGVGAILVLAGEGGKLKTSYGQLLIKTKIIESENIARLEIITALWAIDELKRSKGGELNIENAAITLYTDCRAIENLLSRRAGLEERNYQSKASSQTLANADLYKQFFAIYDQLPFSITWVKGHSPTQSQSAVHRVFSHVDKAAREKLREYREKKS